MRNKIVLNGKIKITKNDGTLGIKFGNWVNNIHKEFTTVKLLAVQNIQDTLHVATINYVAGEVKSIEYKIKNESLDNIIPKKINTTYDYVLNLYKYADENWDYKYFFRLKSNQLVSNEFYILDYLGLPTQPHVWFDNSYKVISNFVNTPDQLGNIMFQIYNTLSGNNEFTFIQIRPVESIDTTVLSRVPTVSTDGQYQEACYVNDSEFNAMPNSSKLLLPSNNKYIDYTKCGTGAKISIGVNHSHIPYIIEIIKPVKAPKYKICGCCGSKLRITKNATWCDNSECFGLSISKNQQLLKNMGIDFKLIIEDFESVIDIANLYKVYNTYLLRILYKHEFNCFGDR